MSTILEGFVQKIVPKQGVSKKTGKSFTVHNVLVDETWIGWGFDAPSFVEGDKIKVELEQNGQYLNYKGGKLRVEQGKAPVVMPGGAAGSGDSRQQAIIYQNSRTAAVHLVETLLAADALPISAAKNKGGQAKRFEEILEVVNKLTVEFFFDVETLRKLEQIEDSGDVEAADPDPLPENEQDPEDDFGAEENFDDDIPF